MIRTFGENIEKRPFNQIMSNNWKKLLNLQKTEQVTTEKNMEPTIKDKYIIFRICRRLPSAPVLFIATLIVAGSFNQDKFVRLIVFVCSNPLAGCSILFQTVIFDSYEIWKIKFGKKRHLPKRSGSSGKQPTGWTAMNLYPNQCRQAEKQPLSNR